VYFPSLPWGSDLHLSELDSTNLQKFKNNYYGYDYLKAAEVISRAVDTDASERRDTEEHLGLSLIPHNDGFLK
jgi:hypothetical protein